MSSTAELLGELDAVTADLIGDHREMAEFLSAEKRAKVEGFESVGGSLKERENYGSMQALDLTTDIFRLRGKIAGAEARVAYLKVAIAAQG